MKIILRGLILSVILGIVLFAMRGHLPGESRAKVAPISIVEINPARASALAKLESLTSQTDAPKAEARETLAERERKALQEKLLNFRKLDVLALRTKAQEDEYRQMLSNPTLLREIYLFLTRVDETQSLAERVPDSIVAIDFFTSALRWQSNPARGELIQKVTYYLLSESYKDLQDEGFRSAVAGDQVELYMLLSQEAPEAAKDLKDHSRGTHLAKIIQFTEDTYLRNRHAKQNI